MTSTCASIQFEGLKYRLLGSEGDIGLWGHEFVRNLAGEVAQEYAKQQREEDTVDDLMHLHNAEPEAVYLLMDADILEELALEIERSLKTSGVFPGRCGGVCELSNCKVLGKKK